MLLYMIKIIISYAVCVGGPPTEFQIIVIDQHKRSNLSLPGFNVYCVLRIEEVNSGRYKRASRFSRSANGGEFFSLAPQTGGA